MNTLADIIVSSGFQTFDFIIISVYVILIVSLGLFISYSRWGKEKSAKEYFFANNTLKWWAISASLIAANISAEQFIGMSGSSYADGLAIASYEIIAAIVLVIIARFVLPILIERRIFTIPQFFSERYNSGVGLAFSILWMLMYVFINLTSISWLGALAIEQIFGLNNAELTIGELAINLRIIIIFVLFVIAGSYTIYGGLAAVAWTDVLQTAFFIGGGFLTAWITLQQIGSIFDTNAIGMLHKMYVDLTSGGNAGDPHLHLIIRESVNPDTFSNSPGIAVIIGGLLLTNIGYWGCNQYIIQKGLAASNIKEGRKGLVFAGIMKLFIPFFILIPGLCTYYMLHHQPEIVASMNMDNYIDKSDNAYAWIIQNFAPTGIKGLAFATIIAAIVSTLASIINSTSTIFTMDIYKRFFNPTASDRKLVHTGRVVSICALILAFIATKPLLVDTDQAFYYIQENSAFIYPGMVIVFCLGLFWKRASTPAAIVVTLLTIPLGVMFRLVFPEIPFHIRTGYTFIILFFLFVTISLASFNTKPSGNYSPKDCKKMRIWALILGGFGLAIILFTATTEVYHWLYPDAPFTTYLHDIGIRALYFFGVIVGGNAIWLWSNAKDKKQDKKAFPIKLSLFHTTKGYTVCTFIISIITIVIYILLW